MPLCKELDISINELLSGELINKEDYNVWYNLGCVYALSEDLIYEILDRFESNQNVDKTLTYVFTKIFYLSLLYYKIKQLIKKK